MTIQGPSRTYLLVKVMADDGVFGMAEAYGTPGIGVKEQILSLKPGLVGKDPLEIDAIYTFLDEHAKDLSGTRTDGSAHNLMRAASGIEMALWDLAGKALGVPTTTLLGGRFRQRVRVYDHAAPRNMLDKASCREWAQKVKADPGRLHGAQVRISAHQPATDTGRDSANRVLTTKELIQIRQGFENCREALGWDHDIMVHCHWEYDLRTAIQIARSGRADQAAVVRGRRRTMAQGQVAFRFGPVALSLVGQAKFENIDHTHYQARVKAHGADSKGRGSTDSGNRLSPGTLA